MTLEQRVQVVENDVKALHAYAQQTHAEREGWYNEFRDARAEARGWGEFAVRAHDKVEEVAGFYKALEGEVKQINGKLTGLEGRFDRLDSRLDGIETELRGHGTMLKFHGEHFGVIETALAEHDRRFDDVDATLKEHGEMLRAHGEMLKAHTEMLKQILAKVA